MASELENVVNSIAEGDDLSTALRKHEPAPTCPYCGQEVHTIYTSRTIHINRVNGEWREEQYDHYCTFQCSNCYEEFGAEDLDKLGVPNEIR